MFQPLVKARDVIFASRRQKNRKRRARAVIPPPGSPGGDQTVQPKRLFAIGTGTVRWQQTWPDTPRVVTADPRRGTSF